MTMQSYATTRAEERKRQTVEKQLKRFLRQTGCTTKRERREAFERGASRP